MSAHSLLSPSSAHRWVACPGSMSFPENRISDSSSSTFADDGTASHHWAALCLQQDRDAEFFVDAELQYNYRIYTMDEDRAGFVQMYLDDVRRRAIGGSLFIEYGVDLGDMSGTADAGIYLPGSKCLIVEDLKYGMGEKVFAKNNPQLMLYALGLLADMDLMGLPVETVVGVICQPRLGHIDEFSFTAAELLAFGTVVREAAGLAQVCADSDTITAHLNPGEKQCRWCRAKAKCPALAKFVTDEVRCDFDTVTAQMPVAPSDTAQLSKAYQAVPLIEQWCNAVTEEVVRQVTAGKEVIGPDAKPYKFVEGKGGSRAWIDEKQAEAALVQHLAPDKAYTQPKIITAPAAAKLLDKLKTKALWSDLFQPLIRRASGKPVLAMGSDPRPPFSGTALAEDFSDVLQE